MGDGQCDSPGFTAKNLCYFLMEMTTGYIIDLEVLDKREVELKSVNMEKRALQNILERITDVLTVGEVVTDASASVKKMMGSAFPTIFHSLDVWYKAKSIRKCISKIDSAKNMEKVSQWADHIINHFWYCCEMASKETSSDEEALRKMKDKWIGLLHHVCNDHDWPGGSCDHGELPEDHSLPWFDRRAKDFEALQKIILDPALLESFKSITLNSDTLVLWSVLIACLLCTHLRKCHSRKRFTEQERS